MENKNCQISITIGLKTNSPDSYVYHLDDIRVAQAICNILDNIAEVYQDGDVDTFELGFITKRTYSGKASTKHILGCNRYNDTDSVLDVRLKDEKL